MSKIGQEIIQMYEDGKIVFDENTNCYLLVNWQEQQRIDMEEIRNDALYDEYKERKAGITKITLGDENDT